MKEEKSMVEYKESRGILGWLKSRFQKIKEKFKPTRNQQGSTKENQEEQELFEEDLDKVQAGIPFKAVNMDELMSDLGITEPKSWDLTEEEHEVVEEGYEEIRNANNQVEQELSEEELDKIIAGQPYVDSEQEL